MTDKYAELRAALDQTCHALLIDDPDTIRALLDDHDNWRATALHEDAVAKAAIERVKEIEAERDALIHDNAEYVSAANSLATENQRLREALVTLLDANDIWLGETRPDLELAKKKARAALEQGEV